MFERIKAYKKLKEINRFLEGAKVAAKLTGNEKMLNDANLTLRYNELIRKEMWHNREMAVAFVQGYKEIGF
ncbi:hypothetical protein DW106_08155 [Ruminococcus sp. AM09-18-1]|jgi:hypothetical protein|nr:hypothetical protein DW106_08155 [Ruminococcus sp. AM09-18-1]DAO17821.1 MAG TPA: hypothetical protein [Caudoviricetes sp.]